MEYVLKTLQSICFQGNICYGTFLQVASTCFQVHACKYMLASTCLQVHACKLYIQDMIAVIVYM